MKKNYYTDGYITLLSVVIFSAVSVAIVTTVLFLGSQSLSSSRDQELGAYGRQILDACIEEALERIKDLESFTGFGSLSFGNGTCSYQVTNNGGTNRTVTASSTSGTIVRKAQATLNQINPTIHITSWSDTN